MGIDLFISCIFMILIERRILGKNYVLFSPFFVFQLSLLYVYIIPVMMYGSSIFVNKLSGLPADMIERLVLELRLFYYPFMLFSIYIFKKLRKKEFADLGEKKQLFTKKFVIISWAILFFLWIILELMLVRFSISNFVGALIHPRDYTYLREGLGPITWFVGICKLLMLFISVSYFNQRKSIDSLMLLLLAIGVNYLGGSKSSLLGIMFYIILIKEKNRNHDRRISLVKIISSLIILWLLVLISFYFMKQSGVESATSLYYLIQSIFRYAEEAYFSARVLNDFTWDPAYIWKTIAGFFATPIPRALFHSKGYYGFYQVYWRPLYQPNTVIYHTSTYGFLAEGHMLFGVLSPFISAVGISLFLYVLYKYYFSTTQHKEILIVSFLVTKIYFFVRAGFLELSSIWNLIIVTIGVVIYFKIMSKYMNKNDKDVDIYIVGTSK